MKNFTGFQARIANLILLAFIVTAGVLLFQANIPQGHVFDDNNPNIEQPTREAYSHFNPNLNQQPSIVTLNDYDNFDIGVDFYT